MKGLVEWAYTHAPSDLSDCDILTILDQMTVKVKDRYLLKHCSYDPVYLSQMTITDLTTVDPIEQYNTLLSHIYVIGIENVPIERMLVYIDWMLNSSYFETSLIVYIWSNSKLNNLLSFPAHSDCIEIATQGCSRYTLKFLWDVAKSGDMFLVDVLKSIIQCYCDSKYLKIFSYTYICSSCDSIMMTKFFSDLNRLSEDDLYKFTENYTLYTWTYNSIETALRMGYTARKLSKYVNEYSTTSFVTCGRVFPINKLSKRLFSVNSKGLETFKLPKIPDDYMINYHMWNNMYEDSIHVVKPDVRNKYEVWFESLNKDKLSQFEKLNPVVFNACKSKEYEFVKVILDDLMVTLGA